MFINIKQPQIVVMYKLTFQSLRLAGAHHHVRLNFDRLVEELPPLLAKGDHSEKKQANCFPILCLADSWKVSVAKKYKLYL